MKDKEKKSLEMKDINEQVNKLFPQITPWGRLKRAVRYWWQRRVRGWDDSETWNLDYSVVKLILPRLRRFKELNNGVPDGLTEEEWDKIISLMIERFEEIVENGMTEDNHPWFLWAKYSKHLWWRA